MVLRNPFRRISRLLARDISSISSLDDPVRSAIYFYVSGTGTEVSRDDAARAVRVSRRVAAIHLDRLAEDGWLDTNYRRLSGRTGPGAGRTSKLYRRSERRATVSVPARNYELMARLLTSAWRRGGGKNTADKLEPGAREFGAAVGASIDGRSGPAGSGMDRLVDLLVDLGFEPFDDAGVIRLRNCPYHELARENRDLICSLNHALLTGMAEGAGVSGREAVRDPKPGLCCVAFRPMSQSAAGA